MGKTKKKVNENTQQFFDMLKDNEALAMEMSSNPALASMYSRLNSLEEKLQQVTEVLMYIVQSAIDADTTDANIVEEEDSKKDA